MAKYFLILATLALATTVLAENENNDDSSIMSTVGALRDVVGNLGSIVISVPNTLMDVFYSIGLVLYYVAWGGIYGDYGLFGTHGVLAYLFFFLTELLDFIFGEYGLYTLLRQGFLIRVTQFAGTLLNGIVNLIGFFISFSVDDPTNPA